MGLRFYGLGGLGFNAGSTVQVRLGLGWSGELLGTVAAYCGINDSSQ